MLVYNHRLAKVVLILEHCVASEFLDSANEKSYRKLLHRILFLISTALLRQHNIYLSDLDYALGFFVSTSSARWTVGTELENRATHTPYSVPVSSGTKCNFSPEQNSCPYTSFSLKHCLHSRNTAAAIL